MSSSPASISCRNGSCTRQQRAWRRASAIDRDQAVAEITGWWQINGRSEVAPEEALHLDQLHIENWSLTLDLYIVLKTFGAVLRREGAY